MGAFATLDPQQDGLAIVLFGLGQRRADVRRLVDRMAARLKNDVADLQALLRGHAIGIDVGYDHALASRSLDAGGRGEHESEAAKRIIVPAHARSHTRFLVVRQRAELYRRGFLRSIVPIDQIGFFPGAEGRHLAREVARTVDPATVNAE